MKKLPILNYTIKNQTAERLDVYIDGQIVDAATKAFLDEWYDDQPSVSFKSFRDQILNSGLKNIRITINSQGGQVTDAMAMHDFIKQLENDGYKVETIGMGLVCSAATYILSAATNSKISPNSWYMIHAVSGGAWGTVEEIENYATTLRTFNDSIRDFYVNLTGKTEEQIADWMSRDTWFTGKQAVANKFVKELETSEQFEQPINAANFMFNNTQALAAYNSVAENTENLIQNLDMKNLATLIGTAVSTALTNFSVTPKPAEGAEGATPEPVTNEALTDVITNALAEIKFDEHITNALTEMFKDGLPENMVTQITDAVKPAEAAPLNLAENEDYKGLINRVSEVEKKILNGVGAVQPPKNEDNEKFEGVSFD